MRYVSLWELSYRVPIVLAKGLTMAMTSSFYRRLQLFYGFHVRRGKNLLLVVRQPRAIFMIGQPQILPRWSV